MDQNETFFDKRRVLEVLHANIFFGARSTFMWPDKVDMAENVQNPENVNFSSKIEQGMNCLANFGCDGLDKLV